MPRSKGAKTRLLVTSLSTLIIGTALIALLYPQPAGANTLSVTTEAELRSAITSAAPGDIIDISSAPSATITLNQPLELRKNVTLQGGTLLVSGDFRHVVVKETISLNFENATLKGCSSVVMPECSGGGIELDTSSEGMVYLTAGKIGGGTGTISDIYKDNNSRAIYAHFQSESSDLTIDGVDITNNPTGGIWLGNQGTINFVSGTLSGNGVLQGGGLLATYVNISGGTISNNTSEREGGGVYCGGIMTMTGGTIEGNHSELHGGGVHIAGSFTMTGGTIANNTSSQGGGIYRSHDWNNSPMVIGPAATITGNTARLNGGGIYVDAGTLIIGGTISNNTAIGDTTNILNGGGGIFLSSTEGFMGGVTPNAIIESTAVLTGNSVTNGRGGAIYTQLFTRVSTELGATFNNNTAIAVPWLISDNDVSMQETISTYNTQIKSTTMSTLAGSDNIYNGYDINFAAAISDEPVIDGPVMIDDEVISGTADVPGATITVYFRNGDGDPNNNPKATTTVRADGTWQITIPNNVTLSEGEVIEATQTANGLMESTADDAIVMSDEAETPPAQEEPEQEIGAPNTGFKMNDNIKEGAYGA